MRARFAMPLILSATLTLGAAVTACGGSSSETPYPVEPVPHSVKPLKHNQSGTGGQPAAAAPSADVSAQN